MSLQAILQNQQEELTKLQAVVQQLKSKGATLEQITDGMNNKEQAELNLNLAYTLSSIYFVYLKLNSIETQSHPIINELTRVQSAFQRLHQPQSQKQQQQPNPIHIDKQAATRLMQANVKQIDNNAAYQQKQQQLTTQERDNSKRLDLEQYQIEKKNLNMWDEEGDPKQQKSNAQKSNQQKLVKGNLMPKTGHLSWKKEIDKIINK